MTKGSCARVAKLCMRVMHGCVTAGGQPVAALSSAAAAAALEGVAPLWHDMSLEQLQAIDWEGRTVITDHGAFVLFNVGADNTNGHDGL